MKRFLFLISLFVGVNFPAAAQNAPYSIAFGLRAGETGQMCGGTIKGFVTNSLALEGMFGYWHKGLTVTALAEQHYPLFRVRGLNWYFGGGLHVAGQTGYSRWYDVQGRGTVYEDGGMGFGIDAIFGVEFKIPVAPVAFSIDFKPYTEINSHGQLGGGLDPGLSVKLAF